ncbi:MAG TPA: gliding motility-associated C-terminal domain-containing protein, partial [Agriterribacter sp.]|nr:gliding motility-associated C-terminal domain-containing protein [Agriterribacter sp.]
MMRWKTAPLIFICTLFLSSAYAQPCTHLGQNPATAFPVCGTSTFTQQTVPACGGRSIPVPGCENDNAAYGDLNPFWYKFTCFSSGTLGFTISPITGSDDYDWQLFDITGHDAAEVYTNRSLYVASNWSARPGSTGTASNAGSFTNCAGFDYPNQSKMPVLTEGHQYLLLVSHFTITNQSGYKLSFGGGTANITDPKEPHLQDARAYCDGANVIVKLNKKMRCNSLAADGSDFAVSNPAYSVTGASAAGCLSGFDMDSVILTLNSSLPPGNYSIIMKKGSDDNTLLDNCDRGIAEEESIPFSVLPVQPTPMDSLTTPGCAPDILQLVFRKPIRCNSIAPDGSDFTINGSPAVAIASASGECNDNDMSSIIHIKLSAPILQNGSYSILLKKGSDGNTVTDECGEETPAGATLSFITKDTVAATFGYSILYGCEADTVMYSHNGANGVNHWNWQFDDHTSGNSSLLQKIYPVFGLKHTTLIVSNGVCSDTAAADIFLDNELKADFEAPEFICPRDSTVYTDASTGNIASWNWSFGNGTGSGLKSPPAQSYQAPLTDQEHTIRLIITNNLGCRDTAVKSVKLVSSCYIDIPSAFTPNGDALNDYLYPLNAYKATDLVFRVYNVYGQKVFETTD